jgi:hypothetical protein
VRALSDDLDRTTGDRLRESLARDGDPYELTVLITEACRIAHRLDQLDRLLSGDAELWLYLAESRGDVEVRVDNALPEARQQANVLRQLLAEIKRRRGSDDGRADEYDPLDDL